MGVPRGDSYFSQKWALAEWSSVPSAGDCVSKKGSLLCECTCKLWHTNPQHTCSFLALTHTHFQGLFRLCVCVFVCALAGRRCHSTMCGQACSTQTTTWVAPWRRATKPSSSPASPQRSWEVSADGLEGGLKEWGGWGAGELKVRCWQLMFHCENNALTMLQFSRGKGFFHLVPLSERDRMHWFPIIICREIKSVTGLPRIKGGCY